MNREDYTDPLVAESVLRDFVERILPQLNRELETRHGGLGDLRTFVRAAAPIDDQLAGLRVAGLKSDRGRLSQARRLLQLLTFVAASIERHAQGRHAEPGRGLGQLRQVPRLLHELSEVAAHPPCGTAETYWLWNAGQRFSFLGEESERFFGAWVRRTDQVVGRSAQVIRAIVQDELPMGEEAARQLQWVAADLRGLREGYRSFMPPERSQWPLTPDQFNRMRQYLVGYPVTNESWPGINAANLTSQGSLDALLGTTSSWYLGVIYARLRLVPDEARRQLIDDLSIAEQHQTLLDMVVNCLAPSMDLVAHRQAESGLEFIGQSLPTSFARAVLEVAKAWSALSGTHWRMIVEYLARWKPDSPEATALFVNPPSRSTGGASHTIPERIRELRHSHRLIHTLHMALETGPRTAA